MDNEFTCPECGGHYWGSSTNPDKTFTRGCSGYTGSGADVRLCRFRWHQSDDAKYMKPTGKPFAPLDEKAHARACDARHIARLERLARAQAKVVAAAEERAGIHCPQLLDVYGRLALAEKGRRINARATAGAELTEARERLERTPRKDAARYEAARVAVLGAETRYQEARRAEAVERSGV